MVPARMRSSATALACAALLGLAGPAVAADRARIAVLPIVVHSQQDPGYLRDGLADMLAARLGRNPGIAVVRVGDPARATTDPVKARATTAGLGADYVLFGSFTQFGAGASLDIQCLSLRADGASDPRSIFVHAGAVGEIIPQLDALSDKVVRYVVGGPAATEPPPPLADPQLDGAALRDALAEIEELRRRVDRLEQGPDEDTVSGLPPPGEALADGEAPSNVR